MTESMVDFDSIVDVDTGKPCPTLPNEAASKRKVEQGGTSKRTDAQVVQVHSKEEVQFFTKQSGFDRQISGSSSNWTELTQEVIDDETEEPLTPVPKVFRPVYTTRKEKLAMKCAKKLSEYEFLDELGSGAYGTVRKARHTKTGDVFAMKTVSADEMQTVSCYDQEIMIAWQMQHPFIVTLVESIKDNDALHLMMELCSGGNLTDKVNSRWYGDSPRGLPQAVVARYVWEMLSGISYLHQHSVVHRDCKPLNYMLSSDSDAAPLKLIDFGLAEVFKKGTPMTLKVGTPAWSAPEVGKGSYDEKCDVWSIGAITYLCCVGYQPFNGDTAIEIMKAVRDKPVAFNDLAWGLVKPKIKTIVKDMLIKDPAERQSANRLAGAHESWLMVAKRQDERLSNGQACCVIG